MNNCIDIKKFGTTLLLIVSGMVCFSQATIALPEDAKQETLIEGGTSELDFARGVYIIRENAEGLAHIKQGSLEIFGSEIRLEIIDGVLKKAVATGTPARFQQQPAIDQAVVFLSGRTLDYDINTRMLNVEGDASYSQDGNTLNGLHIDYHLDTRKVNATASAGENVQIVIKPPPADQP